jgi:ABC-type branched-subunit amino acid transport system substrate-binding protein
MLLSDTSIRSRRSRHALAVGSALLTLAAVSLAGCSQTKKDSSSAPTSASVRTTRGVTDTSIKVGGMMYSAFFSGADVGARARFDRANREGGVFGRKIQLVGVTDTSESQATSAAIARKLVTQDQVFALVPIASSELGFTNVVNEQHVPYFGYGVDPVFCGNPFGFSFTGCATEKTFTVGSDAAGLVTKAYFSGNSNKTAAVIGEDLDAGRGGVKLIAESLRSEGFTIVYAKNPMPAPPAPVGDYSPFVSDLLTSDQGSAPDMIYEILTGADSVGLYQGLRAAGYRGLTVLPTYDPRVATAVDGAAVIAQFAPYEAAGDIPRLQQMINDVHAINPHQLLTIGLAAGYWSADMFLALLQKTGRDLTAERLLAASRAWSFHVPGVIGTSHWPLNHGAPVPCASLSMAKGGSFVPEVPLTCGRIIRVK